MQNAALRATGLADSWHYQLLPLPPELFDETVRALPQIGFRGANVTLPHKQAALALADEASARATAIGAANTLLFGEGGRIWADNTDAPALTQALTLRTAISGASALVLGAGGSARAAVWALRDAGVGELLVWNRTHARAAALAADLGARAVAEPVGETDILVNCTSLGLRDDDRLDALPLDPDQLKKHRVVADFVYHKGGTPLSRAAQASGVATIDGLELLIGQGAIAFELFTGRPAPVQAMRDALGVPV